MWSECVCNGGGYVKEPRHGKTNQKQTSLGNNFQEFSGTQIQSLIQHFNSFEEDKLML